MTSRRDYHAVMVGRLPGLIRVLLPVVAGLTLVGCANSPFPEGAPRTPYARYDALRGVERPAVTEDSFGREIPDLRARLSPLRD